MMGFGRLRGTGSMGKLKRIESLYSGRRFNRGVIILSRR